MRRSDMLLLRSPMLAKSLRVLLFVLLAPHLHALITCAGKRDEYNPGCSMISDAGDCEQQIACFLVNRSACVGDLTKYGAVEYGIKRVRFMLPKQSFFKSVIERAAEFERCTGVFIDVATPDGLSWGEANALANEDLGEEQCSLDIEGDNTWSCIVRQGLETYDGYLIKSAWVAEYADAALLEPLNDFIRDSGTKFGWTDIQKSIRDNVAVYGSEIVIMPVDADFSGLLIREDALENYYLETGLDIIGSGGFQRWDDLVEFVKYFGYRDWDGDGELDYTSCMARCAEKSFGYMAMGGPLYMIFASIVQTLGITQGIHFDPETMDPLFDNDGFELALKIFKDISYECRVADDSNECPTRKYAFDLFSAGKCVVLLENPGGINSLVIGTPVGRKGALGNFVWQPTTKNGSYADARRMRVPGSSQVLDRSTKTLVPCSSTSCPLATHNINRSPLINGGNSLAIRKSAQAEAKKALKDFFAYLNSPSQSTIDTATPKTWNNHWRKSHVSDSAWPIHQKLGWTEREFKDLQKVVDDLGSLNPSLELRLRGYTEYVYTHFETLVRKHFGYEEVENSEGDTCLHAVSDISNSVKDVVALQVELTKQWNAITDKFGRLEQLLRYRRSLALPALTGNSCGAGQGVTDAAGVFINSLTLAEGCNLCPPGHYSVENRTHMWTFRVCVRCLQGYVQPELGSTSCLACNQGKAWRFAGGLGICEECAPGAFAEGRGRSECSECSQGKFNSQPGKSECSLCSKGTYLDNEGQTECKRCEIGAFAASDGSIMCTDCLGTLTTQYLGAALATDCACRDGTFRDAQDRNLCRTCLEGMSCAFGADAANFGTNLTTPELKPFYYTTRERPLYVYLCLEEGICLGGEPDTCKGGRVGLACAGCPDNHVISNDKCKECGPMEKFILVCVIILAVVALGCVHIAGTSEVKADTDNILGLSISFGMLITSLQVLASFKQLNILWPETVRGSMGAVSFMMFDPDSVSIVCIFGSDPTTHYALRASAPYVIVCLLLLMFTVSNIIFTNSVSSLHVFHPWDKDSTINTICLVLQTLLTPFALTTATAFQCYTHPNSEQSLVDYPAVRCGSLQHVPLIILAVVGMLTFIFPFLVMSIWVNLNAPTRCREGDRFLVRFSYFFYRFRPAVWWWGSVLTVRQLLLAFAPILDPDDPHAQIYYIEVVLSLYMCAQVRFWPWTCMELNSFELVISMCLLFFVAAAASIPKKTENPDAYIVIMILLFLSIPVIAGCIVSCAAARALLRGMYQPFGYRRNVDGLHRIADKLLTISMQLSRLSHQDLVCLLQYLNPSDQSSVEEMTIVISALDPHSIGSTKRLAHVFTASKFVNVQAANSELKAIFERSYSMESNGTDRRKSSMQSQTMESKATDISKSSMQADSGDVPPGTAGDGITLATDRRKSSTRSQMMQSIATDRSKSSKQADSGDVPLRTAGDRTCFCMDMNETELVSSRADADALSNNQPISTATLLVSCDGFVAPPDIEANHPPRFLSL